MATSLGRPVTCTPERIEIICQCMQGGCPLELACELAGTSYDAFRKWYEEFDSENENHSHLAELFEKVTIARRDFALSNLKFIMDARSKDWKAAERLLSWEFPSNFSKNSTKLRIDQSLNINGSVESIMIMQNSILDQLAQGKLTVEAAKEASATLEAHRRVAETMQIKERVDLIEQKVRNSGQE